jgi:diaminohydroxyphosphoribosylaminopyrimidine deaminase/5-amino-6-(5-phosphoribosylamino)uracil reductase
MRDSFPDPKFMRLAIRLARKGVGRTAPNPAVGAVLVRDGKVVGRGWHKAAGRPHAEIEAIRDAGPLCMGADLYVTLEPCCHTGKTGPCTEAVLGAGIRRVAAAMRDPNPLVAGKGFERLRSAGLAVHLGLEEPLAFGLNREWVHRTLTGRPFVTLKLAASLDGQIAGSTGESRWVTGEKARVEVHRMRSRCDAVLVGGETARRDDPLLTCRLRGGSDPARIVLSGKPETLAGLRMFEDRSAPNIVLVPASLPRGASAPLLAKGVEVVRLKAAHGRIPAGTILEALAARGVVSLMVEGGGGISGTFLSADAVDRLVMFFAPLMMGEATRAVTGWGAKDPSAGRRFAIRAIRRYGDDFMVDATPAARDAAAREESCSPG